ncbi:MAG TPA: SMP-30/gluconolactonase/LRE family protein [Aquabacterium sp.]|uniref:SMP-30/gluconolactonase/LRE family protein n=1 Tax=Aquabacterium sp. TaxID=1872578 RepID=UPI002E382451|nr:SMP-30/gluconolactonase/LRE family protein [Aquabacterium sp.]HEX5372615.1 SMP-30/gluconolactonase/LRE family protein [Aquabacterium sp.]
MTIKHPRQRGFLRFLTSWLTPLIALLAYLLFWPVPIEPVAWQAPENQGYSGPHASNTRLAALKQWPLAKEQVGPEHITAYHGAIYTALSNGDVVRIDENGQATTLLNTGGRPLGLDISPTGRMYIADAMKGLLTVNLLAPTLQAKALLTKIDNPLPDDPLRYADAVAVDPRGNVWLTDASRRFGAAESGGTFEASVLDILEHSCTGRVLVMDPVTERSRVALSGLCFPNGLAFSQDGKHMFLSETGTYRILKIDLARLSVTRSTQGMSTVPSLKNAFDQGAAKVLIDNLPGYPDNLMRGEQGRIWVGLTKPRSPILDMSASKPWLRSMMLRLPRAAWPVPKAYGHIIAFDEDGRIVDDLQDPTGAYPETTAATEMNGKLYVQSLHAHSVGWMPYPAKP